MKINRAILTVPLTALFLCGCQTRSANRQPAPAASAEERAHAAWSNGYALLHQLMTDESDVSKLRFIKREQPDVKDLINRIAKAADEAAKQLEAYDQDDGGADLKELNLPPGEQMTRDSIASTKQWELLGHNGEQFELSLLLTQSEAMSYGWHLAEVAGKNDSRPERARYLKDLSKRMKGFYHEIYLLLLARTKTAPDSADAPVKK